MTSQLEYKIQSIINMLDNTILKQDNQHQNQERFYRVYKALISISKHSEAVVSAFDAEEEKLSDTDNESLNDSFKSEYLSITNDNEIKICGETIEINQLLSILEKELENNNSSHDSIEGHPINQLTNDKNLNSLKRKFFKIEMILKSYLEEKKAFTSSNRKSIPLNSLRNKSITALPSIVTNFFADKETLKKELANTHKRYSAVNIDFNCQLNQLTKVYQINSSSFKKPMACCNSEIVDFKHSAYNHNDNLNEVSNFNMSLDQSLSSSTENTITDFKLNLRNSLLSDKHMDESKKLSKMLECIEEDN